MGRICSRRHAAAVSLFSALILTLFLAVALELPLALAQEAASQVAAAPNAAQANTPFQFILSTVNFFLIAFFVYYMLVLRPSQLKQEQQARFLRDVKKDDEVVTSGGILGRVAAIQPEFISVEIASGTRVRVRPEHVSPLQPKKSAGAEPRSKQPAEKERKTK